MMIPSVLVPLAPGCEELEAVTVVDLLRRANIEVVTAGLDNQPVKASRGVVLVPDMTLDEAMKRSFDMIVLPGGLPGADHLNNDPRILKLLKEMQQQGKFTAAICAAPKVLLNAGILAHKSVTHYPGAVDRAQFPEVKFIDTPVVRDGKVVTSRGPGTAMDFALELIEALLDKKARQTVETALVRSVS